jgi:hypothetical protein
MVLAGGSELIDDIRRAPDDVLSVRETRNIVRSAQIRRAHTHGDQFLQLKYLRCPLNPEDEYSTEIIRSKFSRDVASIFEQVRGELAMAIDDLIPTNEYGT